MGKILLITLSSIYSDGRTLRAYTTLRDCGMDVMTIEFGEKQQESRNRIILEDTKSTIKNLYSITRTLLSILKTQKFEFIYVSNYYACLPALVAKIMDKTTLVYDAYELFYPRGGAKFTIRDYLFYFLEKTCIKKAKCIIAANRERALVMQGYYKLDKLPFVIENYSGNPGQLIAPKKIDMSCIKVVYAGYISKARGLAEMISAVEQVRNTFGINIELHIYGSGIDVDYFIQEASYNEYIYMHEKYSNNDLPNILKLYDIGFLYYPVTGINNIYCAPNKLYDYCYSGLPIVANENVGLIEKINRMGVGNCSQRLDQALKVVIDDYQLFSNNSFLVSKNDYMKEIKTVMKNVIDSVLESKPLC